LKDHPRISDETKKAVQRAAQKLNYQPNHIAAALRRGRSNILGIIVPTVDRSFFASVVHGIEEIANRSGYNVMICQSHDDYEKEVATIEALLNAQVDGIIASFAKGTQNFNHFKKVMQKGIPLIMFDRANDELEVSHVVIDDFLGAFKATEHLIKQGCRRVGHFTGIRKVSIYSERLRGYKEALLANNIKYDESLIVESDMQLEDGRKSMQKLLRLGQPVDAVFSASAYGAVGALQICKEKGVRVPQDVALVGFTDEPFTSFSEPPLTTVDQHSLRMGNTAAEMFFDQVATMTATRKFIPQKTVLKPDLIIRASSLKNGR
jgi:LacI family transcriptional regulator